MQKNNGFCNSQRRRFFRQADCFKLFGRKNNSQRLRHENRQLFKDKRRIFGNGQHYGRALCAKGRLFKAKTIQIIYGAIGFYIFDMPFVRRYKRRCVRRSVYRKVYSLRHRKNRLHRKGQNFYHNFRYNLLSCVCRGLYFCVGYVRFYLASAVYADRLCARRADIFKKFPYNRCISRKKSV